MAGAVAEPGQVIVVPDTRHGGRYIVLDTQPSLNGHSWAFMTIMNSQTGQVFPGHEWYKPQELVEPTDLEAAKFMEWQLIHG